MNTRYRRTICLTALLILLTAALIGCGGEDVPGEPKKPESTPVQDSAMAMKPPLPDKLKLNDDGVPILRVYQVDEEETREMDLESYLRGVLAKLYPTFTLGYDWFDASDEYAYPIAANNNLYKVEGLYFRVGALYNIWKKDYSKPLNPMAFLGVNYGCSPHFQYTIENYPINNEYWSSNNNTFQANGHTISHWGEVVGGVKTPIAKNFCLGFEVMYKFLLHIRDQQSGNNLIHQSYSPGFGDKESGMWGFRYTISYFFHL